MSEQVSVGDGNEQCMMGLGAQAMGGVCSSTVLTKSSVDLSRSDERDNKTS